MVPDAAVDECTHVCAHMAPRDACSCRRQLFSTITNPYPHPKPNPHRQLYSTIDDPAEVVELMATHSLLAPMPAQPTPNATAAGMALATLRNVMQADLSKMDRACGVA